MTTKLNLVINQGADFSATFNMKAANGATIDLSTYTCASKIRKTYTSTNTISFTTSLSNTGNIVLSMNSSVTANIIPGLYLYDVEITSAANVVSRVIEGIVDVDANITR